MGKRLDKIKAARSLGDVMDVIDDIAYEFKNSSAIVRRIISSLSGTITFDARRTGTAPGIKDVKYVAPNANELQKHVDVIHKLNDNLSELAAAEAMIKQAFSGHKKTAAALKAVKELRDDLDALLNDAYAALHEIADKHIPTKMNTMVDGIVSHLIDVLPVKKYTGIQRSMSVAPAEEKGIFQFCYYIGVENLQNAQGFTYHTYYVIVTGLVDGNGNMHLYVNGLPEFKAPGKYPIGTEILDMNAARKRIDLLLAHNDFIVDHEKQPFGITDDRAQQAGFTSIKGIAGIKIADDEFLVTLAPGVTEKQRDEIKMQVWARLSSLVGVKKKDQLFQTKNVRRGSQLGIKFIIVPSVGKKANLSLQRLNEVAEELNLTDKQKAALRFALQH